MLGGICCFIATLVLGATIYIRWIHNDVNDEIKNTVALWGFMSSAVMLFFVSTLFLIQNLSCGALVLGHKFRSRVRR